MLEKSLLSDDMLKKISNAIDEFVTTQSGNDETIEQFALHYLSSDDINAMRSDVTGGIVKLVTAKLQNSDLGSSIAHMATEHVMEKTRNSLAGRLGAEMFIQPLAQPIEKILAKHINEILQNNSQQMIQDLVNKEASELMGMTMSQLTTGRDEQVEQIKRGVLNAYRTIIIEHLPRILQDIDISTIIEQRINEMDMNEAEAIIMDVMKKELRAIVWLGALLGCIMGTINALI